jgi:ABC-2 type transport system permease protein
VRENAAMVSARFRTLLQYRAAALAGIGTQIVFGLIHVTVLGAFYAVSPSSQPMTYPQTVAYVWLGQAMLGMLPWNYDREVVQMIRSGNVAYELLRPLDLYGLWYSRALAMRTAPTLLRAVPMFVIASLFLGFRPPPSFASGAAWAAATLGALALSSALTVLMSVSALWTVSGEGAFYLVATAATVFSGMVIPLPLFPDWLQPVLSALPFRGLCDVPFRLYSGNIPPSAAVVCVVQQLAWVAVLIVFSRLLLARGLRRLVVQGG